MSDHLHGELKGLLEDEQACLPSLPMSCTPNPTSSAVYAGLAPVYQCLFVLVSSDWTQ